MSPSRPRRKAASNKNYLDTAHDPLLDQIFTPQASKPASVKSPKKKASPKDPSVPAAHTQANGKPSAPGIPFNWQPPLHPGNSFLNKLNLSGAYVNTLLQTLTCPNQPMLEYVPPVTEDLGALQLLLLDHLHQKPETLGQRRKSRPQFQLKRGDFIYMVSEPPGEPYYIGRIMSFKRKSEEQTDTDVEEASKFVFLIQWFYRPRDILKQTSDSRLLFASMHSDVCPLTSFRGFVTVNHRLDVERYFAPPKNSTQYANALEYYSSFPNYFYFDKLFDRYMIKFYDIIKTEVLLPYIKNATNNNINYILALNKRFEYVFMEAARVKIFINNFNSTLSTHCDICAEWCPSAELVTCAKCEKHFHMLCLDPPLLRKPSRGFSWSCALCTKKHELEHQSKKMLMLSHDNRSSNQDEILSLTDSISSLEDAPTEKKTPDNIIPHYEVMAAEFLRNDALVSVKDRRLKEEWNLRYLGQHVRLEDAVDLEDRSLYPRASTSLGTKFQASNIPEFEDHPIVYYDPEKPAAVNQKKKAVNGRKTKKDSELESVKALPIPEEYQDVSPKEFPQWLQPRPKGYIERGVDDGEGETCTLLWKPLESDEKDNFTKLDHYTKLCAPMAESLDLHPNSPNFVDAILKAYMDCNGDIPKALDISTRLSRKILKEPTFSKEELRKFEAGVKKFGSELGPVAKEVKTQPCSMVVRFYYIWKKSPKGRLIWGNYHGRKKKATMKVKPVVDDYADSDDDSAYENEKIIKKNKLFRCKHCHSYVSYRWHKITGYDGTTQYDSSTDSDDIDPDTVTALCYRCAKLWRRYAVYWEDPAEVERKNTRGVGGYRKKLESELIEDSEQILLSAEKAGGLSYNPDKQSIKSSVLEYANGVRKTNGVPKAPPRDIPKVAKQVKDSLKETSPSLSASKSRATSASTSKTLVKSNSRLTSSQKSSVKQEAAEPQPKRRKTERVSQAKKAPEGEKKIPAPKAESVAKSKKAPPPVEVKAEPAPEPKVSKAKKVEATPAPKVEARTVSTKRLRKNADPTAIVSPIFNLSYQQNLPELAIVPRVDKRLYPQITKDALEDLIQNFGFRQLTDMRQLTQGWQAPHQAKIDLPFPVNDRKCCICLDLEDADGLSLETLICSNCGVNVHGSCAGISISGKVKPVRQWLCEACTNDLGSKYDTSYSCSVCFSRAPTTDLTILGSPRVRPDYLVPVLESKSWCHLICALYGYQRMSFRHVPVPTTIPKDILNSTQTRSLPLVIESVSRTYAENMRRQCAICQLFNGSLVQCHQCNDDDTWYHVTCAQETPEFKLGFLLAESRAPKALSNTIVMDQKGRLEPALICPKHDQKGTFFHMREQGKRTPFSESKPLIQLFIEDLTRSQHRLSGQQLKAHNYIAMMDLLARGRDEDCIKKKKQKTKVCAVCKTSSSPMWNKRPEKPTAFGDEYSHVCQTCFLLEDDAPIQNEREGDSFIEELNKPLEGSIFGVKHMQDYVTDIQSCPEPKIAAIELVEIKSGELLD